MKAVQYSDSSTIFLKASAVATCCGVNQLSIRSFSGREALRERRRRRSGERGEE